MKQHRRISWLVFVAAALILAAVTAPGAALAQTPTEVDRTEALFESPLDSILAALGGDSARAAPPLVGGQVDTALLADWRAAQLARYRYQVAGLSHRESVFRWQLFSSKVIFWAVLVLVATGIFFSGVQFFRGFNAEAMQSELELSTGGVKVSSPVLGVIILVLSLAFFYLYLVYVYPIKEIF